MDYFPAFLRLDGKRCLVVGGGDIATRKARLLLDAGAHLRVVAPQIGAGMANLAGRGRVRLERRKCLDSDVEKCWLVVSASGVPAVEKRVFAAANSAGVFCNAVDDKENCSYITPAIVDRSPIIVAISSSGSTPVLAKKSGRESSLCCRLVSARSPNFLANGANASDKKSAICRHDCISGNGLRKVVSPATSMTGRSTAQTRPSSGCLGTTAIPLQLSGKPGWSVRGRAILTC